MRILIACITAALAFQASEGFAANLGTLDLSSGSIGFGSTPVSGAFTDNYTFTLTTRSTLNGSLISAVNGAQDIDFSSVTITGTAGPSSFSLFTPDPTELWAIGAPGVVLDPGTYTMSLTGSNSAAGGSYGGNIAVTPLAASPTVTPPVGFAGGFVDLTTGSAPLFNSPQIGAFTDTFSFLLANPGIVNGAFTTAANGNQNVDFTSISLTGPSGLFSYVVFAQDPIEAWALPVSGAVLSPGLYTISLNGSNSVGGGSYGGMLAATPLTSALVSEPSSVAIIVLALAACGVVSRRRNIAAGR